MRPELITPISLLCATSGNGSASACRSRSKRVQRAPVLQQRRPRRGVGERETQRHGERERQRETERLRETQRHCLQGIGGAIRAQASGYQ
jgi:hypothetical protein